MRKFSIFFASLMFVSIALVAQEKISFTDLVTIDFNHLAKSKARIQNLSLIHISEPTRPY